MTRAIVVSTLFISAGYSAVVENQPDQIDPRAIVKQSIDNYNHDWREAMSWSYTQTELTKVDGKDEVDIVQVMPLEGTPYDRLISKNGHPLDAEEQLKEDRKYEKAVKVRTEESATERAERIRKYEKARSFIDEVPDAYDFKLLGSEIVNGRPAWVIQLTPRMGFVPESPHASVLRHIEGKLWIDKQDLRWAKAKAPVIDTISIGIIVARIGPGTNFELEQTRISDDLWLPCRIKINGVAHVLLVHDKKLDEQLTFSEYHKDAAASAENITKPLPNPGKSFR